VDDRALSPVSCFARQMPPQIVISAQVAFHSVVPTATAKRSWNAQYESRCRQWTVNYTKTTQRGAAKSLPN
jgi:hypothetical protein